MTATSSRGERASLQRTMQAIVAESKRSTNVGKPQTTLGLSAGAQGGREGLPDRVAELVFDLPARRRLSELVLAKDVLAEIEEFLEEFAQMPLLRASSLEPRHKILLIGPPGNGKTSLAEMIATELALPFLSIRYDALVDSFLGETASRLRRIIEYATANPCVLFFDEFDALGKERSDSQETGEIKRLVGSLLVHLDQLPSHAIVVCATNHPELLDRAVWRRFELKLQIDRPDEGQLVQWFVQFEKSLKGQSSGISPLEFAQLMAGENMSDVEAFTLEVRRKLVLSKGNLSLSDALRSVLERRRQRLTKTQRTLRSDGQQLPHSAAREGAKNRRTNKRQEALFPKEDSIPTADQETGHSL